MTESRPYHHGDLRAALVRAGLEIVEREGHEAVSLRDLARDLGVSRSAPYRHYVDRKGLLTAIAAEGFKALTARYDEVLTGSLSPQEKAKAVNRAYLALAVERPRLFQLMFESDVLDQDALPGDLAARANMPLRPLWALTAAARPDADQKQVKARAVAVWAALHGFAALRRSGKLTPPMIEPLSEEDLTDAFLDFISEIRPS
jgi:AcrR family transcriptional regulator